MLLLLLVHVQRAMLVAVENITICYKDSARTSPPPSRRMPGLSLLLVRGKTAA